MIFTSDYIREYATYRGQMAKIETGCNLIIESAIESLSVADSEAIYTEGVESVVNSLITLVSTAFKTIMDFIGKQVEKVDNLVNGKKYQMMMSPEMKAKFDEVTDGKDVKGIDTVALLKLSKKSEAFIDKFMATVNGEISKAQSDPSYDTSHLKDYCKNSEEAYDKLYKEMERVGTTKKSLKKSDFYAMVKAGNEINTSMKDYKKKMHSMEKQLSATIKKLNKAGYLKEFTEGDTEFRVYNEGVIDSIKSGIQKVINSLKNFCTKHARVCQYVCMAISAVTAVLAYKQGDKIKEVEARGNRSVNYARDRLKKTKEKYEPIGKIFGMDAEMVVRDPLHKDRVLRYTPGSKIADAQTDILNAMNRSADNSKAAHNKRKGLAGVSAATAVAAGGFKTIADEQDRKKKEAKQKAESKED